MKKVTFLFLAILLLYACKEEECNPVSDTPYRDYIPDIRSFGEYTVYYYGECDDEGNFIEKPREMWLAYKGTMDVGGLFLTLQNCGIKRIIKPIHLVFFLPTNS
ncbi:MAG: hypothetical protein CH6_4253 [Candidatus Kapaibacterium sp.]|jgi:hypothetical protein|nr:MAG: hypothetical protein CH6_4253 [Candidatus Kapabacteria bacterium]ROL58496.1 MAG: hypothetical protein D9V84_01860 [Bacteroidetes/Chlorobi group bacterium Naka2016]